MPVTLSATADTIDGVRDLLGIGGPHKIDPIDGGSLGEFEVRAHGYPTGPDGQPIPLTHVFDGANWAPAS